MSGHSKWAQIKRQKNVTDKKRGATFTKLSNAITLAVKQGGGIGDPSQNFKLRLAIDAAKTANMPKENIERAISRAAGKQGGVVEEVIYEGFAPFGVSVIIEAATDNSVRTTSEIKSLFSKAGGNFGQPGSVSYQFKHMGQMIVRKGEKSSDDIFLIAAENGAYDVEEGSENEVFVYTDPQQLNAVKVGLELAGLSVIAVSLIRKPLVAAPVVDVAQVEKIMNFIEKIEEMDDVQKVFSNIDIQVA